MWRNVITPWIRRVHEQLRSVIVNVEEPYWIMKLDANVAYDVLDDMASYMAFCRGSRARFCWSCCCMASLTMWQFTRLLTLDDRCQPLICWSIRLTCALLQEGTCLAHPFFFFFETKKSTFLWHVGEHACVFWWFLLYLLINSLHAGVHGF